MKNSAITEIIGWYGVIALLGAYAMVSFGVIAANGVWFQTLNVTGAIGIVIEASAKKNWQPAVLNIVWAVIGIAVLIKIIL